MAVEVTIHGNPDHVHAEFVGEFSLHAVLEGLNTLAKCCREGLYAKPVAYIRGIRGTISAWDRFSGAEYVAERFPRGISFAGILREDHNLPRRSPHDKYSLQVPFSRDTD